jgi:hypothetical protein
VTPVWRTCLAHLFGAPVWHTAIPGRPTARFLGLTAQENNHSSLVPAKGKATSQTAGTPLVFSMMQTASFLHPHGALLAQRNPK